MTNQDRNFDDISAHFEKKIYGGRCHAFLRGVVEDGVMVVGGFLGKMGD